MSGYLVDEPDTWTFRDVMDECDQAQFREALDLKQALEAQKLRREPLQIFCQACEFSHHGQQMKDCEDYAECLTDWQKRIKAREINGQR
jgi:hypothetical protein